MEIKKKKDNIEKQEKQDNFKEIIKKVEAILFSYGDWIDENQIMQILKLDSNLLIRNSLKELEKKYEKDFAFYVTINENFSAKMTLKKEFEQLSQEIVANIEIPKPVLKVLSVIAYEQPITKTKLSEILGKSVKDEIEFLYKNKFLSYQKHGIGKYYKVTKKFFDYFNLDENDNFREKVNLDFN